jgi:trimeric autotransporter adhesin
MRSVRLLALVGAAMLVSVAGVSAQSAPESLVDSHASVAAGAGVPRLVQFNGTLKDSAARPIAGVASVAFAIYAEQDGGVALWSETQNVLADSNGHFNVLLGAATSNGVPGELFGTGQSRWLGITIARQPEMPRILLASVPYALKAADADTLGGLPASAYVTTASLAASQAAAAKNSNTTIVSSPVAASQSAPAADAAAATQSVTQAAVTGTGTTNYIPLWNSGSNLINSILFQNAGRIGVGTTTPVVTLDVNGDSIFRGSFQLPPQGTATASSGQPSHSFQWEASLYNSGTKQAVTQAYGFRAVPTDNNSGYPASNLDLFYGPGGGTLTDTGLSINNVGAITFVPGQQFNGASESVNEIALPNTTSSSSGVLTMGGVPFLSDTGSSSNSFVGTNAGGMQTTGTYNSAVGSAALIANTTGSENSALGSGSLSRNTNGDYNTAVGEQVLSNNTAGSFNTAIGADSLYQNTTGNGNTAVGFNAGDGNTTGVANTFLGYGADANQAGLEYATAIGYGAIVGSSYSIVLGGTGTNADGVGIGTLTPYHTLDVIDRGSFSYGIFATSAYNGDTAIYGVNTSTTGLSNGGRFVSNSPNGSGVVGVNDSGGYAGYFEATSGGYAGAFVGNVSVSGNLNVMGTVTKGGGAFKIDDPIDPANKYLSHSFVESPDMMDIYNGNVVTDAKGYATVTMPAWFEALNADFRYQLTPMNSFARATVTREMKDGKFRIRTSRPNVKVSWQVTGIRHDAWANAHRIPNEEEKPAGEQGHYLHPELFGAGPDKAIAAVHDRATDAPASAASTAHSNSTEPSPLGQK